MSDRAAAAIATAVLQDIGILTEQDKAIDKAKIRRERAKVRGKKETENEEDGQLTAIRFHGRKDETRIKKLIDGKQYYEELC